MNDQQIEQLQKQGPESITSTEMQARQAFQRIQNKQQVSTKHYNSNDKLDLRTLQSGTLLRVTQPLPESNEALYMWFTITKTAENPNEVDVYLFHGGGTRQQFDENDQLIFPENWRVEKREIPNSSLQFTVKDFETVFWKPEYASLLNRTSIDIIDVANSPLTQSQAA